MEIRSGSYNEPSPLGISSQADFSWELEEMPSSIEETTASQAPIVQNDNNALQATAKAAEGLKGWQRPASRETPPPSFSFGGMSKAVSKQTAKGNLQPLSERREETLQALNDKKNGLQKQLQKAKDNIQRLQEDFDGKHTPDEIHTANSYVRLKCQDNQAANVLIDSKVAKLEEELKGLNLLTKRSERAELKEQIAKLKADKKLLQENPRLIADAQEYASQMKQLDITKSKVQSELSKTHDAIEQKVAENLREGGVHVARLPQTELAKVWRGLVQKHAPALEALEGAYAQAKEQKDLLEGKRAQIQNQMKVKISELDEPSREKESALRSSIDILSSKLSNKKYEGEYPALREELALKKKEYQESFPELSPLKEEHDQIDAEKNKALDRMDALRKEMNPMTREIKAAKEACLKDLRVVINFSISDMLSEVPVIPISVKDTVARSSAQIVDSNNYGMRVDPGTKLTVTRTGDNSYSLSFTENGIQRKVDNCLYKSNFEICHEPLDEQGQPARVTLAIQPGETVEIAQSGLHIMPTAKTAIYCDAACASKEPTGAQVMTFCDGCGQEAAARVAAQIVSTQMQAHLEKSLASGQVTNLREVASKMCDGMRAAQKEMKDNGTTTFTQVAVVSGYAVILANGDSKTFVKRGDGTVVDVTGGSRGNVNDASDPGGRIGKVGGEEEHDYRGLSCYVYKLQPGDQLLVCSDGIHDNFDPETVGVSIQEAARFCGGEWNLPAGALWENTDALLVGKLKQEYMEKKMGEVVGTSDDATAIQKLQQHVADQTRGYKEATFRGEDVKIKSHEEVHGKPDHATGVAMTYMGAKPAKAQTAEVFEPETPYELKISSNILKRVYGRAKAEFTETFVQVFKEIRPHPDNKEKVICIGLDGAPYTYDRDRIVGHKKLDKEAVTEMASRERSAIVDRQFEQQELQKKRMAEFERRAQEQAEIAQKPQYEAEAESAAAAAAKKIEAAEAKIRAKPLPAQPQKAASVQEAQTVASSVTPQEVYLTRATEMLLNNMANRIARPTSGPGWSGMKWLVEGKKEDVEAVREQVKALLKEKFTDEEIQRIAAFSAAGLGRELGERNQHYRAGAFEHTDTRLPTLIIGMTQVIRSAVEKHNRSL